MRVAFDEQIFAIQRYGGISRVFAELARQFIANPGFGVELQPVAAPLVNEYVLKDPLTRKALDVWQSRHWATSIARSMTRRRHKGPTDVVHNTFYLPRALADYPEAKRVVTVHDMIPEIFPQTRRRLDFLTVKRRYVENADHIVCVSESTKRDLLRIYGPLSTPISVVPSGVGSRFSPGVPRLEGWPTNYVLHVGNRRGYKGGTTLFRAFAKIKQTVPDLVLVLAGGGNLTSAEKLDLTKLKIEGDVLQEQVSDRLMPRAYANALVFVMPSEYEGFGLPVLEAMASGTATVLSNASSLPEVGGEAARYFSVGDSDALASAISGLLQSAEMRNFYRQLGLIHSRKFTWQSAAYKTAMVYEMTVSAASR